MRRPTIFVVTKDQDFEKTARDAIAQTARRMSAARNNREACGKLIAESSEIALAIIDVDPDESLSLLRILKGWEPAFPILVVDRGSVISAHDGIFSKLESCGLDKAAVSRELEKKIRELCGPEKTWRQKQSPSSVRRKSRLAPSEESHLPISEAAPPFLSPRQTLEAPGETSALVLWKPSIF